MSLAAIELRLGVVATLDVGAQVARKQNGVAGCRELDLTAVLGLGSDAKLQALATGVFHLGCERFQMSSYSFASSEPS